MGSNKKQLKEISKQKKGKGKRWKKGQSSSSNPETKTFREAAKNRFFQTSKGESSLTVDALAKHDEEQADKDGDVSLRAESDIVSAAGKTFNTWATNWTECTNTTFSRVHRYWASNSAFHKEVLAVLAAVTEVIKTQGGSESETEYFAALMTALETTEGEESVSAVAYLLSLVMKRIPAPVLKSRFAEISKEFLDVLVKYSEGQSPALLKSLLLCLALLLRVQDQATWSNSSTQRVYQGLLAFTVNKKPKVRKAAQQGVNIVLRGSIFMNPAETAPPHHPASSMTAKFCIQVIEQCGGSTESSDTLYILSLLKDIMCTFSLSSLKSVCETILRVMTLSNVMVTSCGMKALYGLFNGNPRATTLNAELNAQMIKALYEYHPSNNDVQPLKAWLAVMEAAHKNLTRCNMWSISKSENAVFMKQKGSIVGKVWDIAAANNKGCIKIMMNGLDKIMRLEDFHAEDNEYSSLFAGHLSSRHSFVERWRTFKKSGQNKSTSTVKRTYSKINPFEFKDDAASDKLDDVTTQKKVHVEVHRPSISDCSEVGDISPLTAEPVGVCEDDLSVSPEINHSENESSSISSEETHTENANKSLVEAIQKKLKGYMVLPVSKLRQPSFINLLREPDLKHVKELEREFKERPGNYFQLMVVNVCGQLEVDNFESCTLEVIGGNHSREALQNIISETPNPSQFEKRMCIVYTNLNPDEAKYVANQHNQVRKFGTDLDLVDRAGCFRYALFEKAGYSNLQDTIGKKTPTNKEIIHKWKEGLQLCMGAVSRKTLNNRFRFEMKLAQLQTEVWVEFLEFKKKLKKEVKKDKISGRLLKPLNGVSSENMLKFLNDYNSEKINFRQLTSLCNESKSNEANKKDESSECEPGTSAMNSEVETFVEPLDDEVEEEEATNDIKLVEELKRTAAREKKRSDELQLKNEELKEALETSNRERDEMKKELSQRLLAEKKMHDEIRQLKEKLNQATKECRILREKQGKLTKRKITAVDATEEVNIPVTKKPSTDNWNFKERPEDLEIGMVVAITPIRQRDVVDGEPWLAITNDVSKARIKVSWLKGSYTTNWIPNPDFEGLDEKLCLGHLPRFFSVCMTCLLSEKAEVASSATKTMKELLRACLAPAVEGTKQVTSAPSSTNTPLHKIVKALETGLGYQFHAAWGLVMQVFAVMFEVAGKECPALFKKSLLSIANLRDSPRFPYKAELDHAVGAAIKYLGPRQVLEAVPLNITGDDDDYSFPRSWLLPVIRDNVCNTELGFFTIYFLPLAAKLRQRSLEAESTGNQVVCKSYDALQRQIWSLLPGFCTQPTDLAQSFKGICKILGSAISDREDLRTEVMSGLRKLINKSKEEEESKQEVARFAKNFLPILFNLFTTEPENAKDTTRLAVLETIKTYLQIADTALINSFCDKCKEKIHEEGVSPFKRHALMDLLLVMLPVVDQTRVEAIFKLTTPFLSDMDKTLQKKCYRVLEELCSSSSEACQMFVTENLSTIQGVLLDSLSTSSPSSKAPRLRCLINIFKILKEEEKDFLLAVVPEAILCTKEIGEKARSASYQLLVEMGRAKMRWNKNENEALEDYFQMVMAGLGGSPQMVSSTLLALTRILYEFKASISMPLLETIVEQLCLLLKSKTREVVKAALGFMKVLLSAYPDTVLAPHLKQIMSSLVSQKEDCKHHFRFKAKEIYAKLIKKFGYETIFGMSPPSIHKVLVNIKKTQERAKKKKKERDSDSEEESDQEHFRSQPESVDDLLRDTDSEEETETKPKRKTRDKTQAKLAWLQEGGDIMDFLDPTASKKVLATKPEEKKDMKKREPAFKMASDGRLIITESSDEEGPEKMGEDEDDLEDLLKAIEQGAGNVKKTKKRKVEDLGSDDEASAPKYKAGGGGIHRPLAKVKRSAPQEAGSEYRAKKAGGDIKKTGRPDPYAYLPLNFQALNKRKKAKMAGRFTNLVKGAKKGAKKGYKGKKKT